MTTSPVLRVCLLLALAACGSPASSGGHVRPAGAEAPPLVAYRELWARLAAERNEMSVDDLLARGRPEITRFECYRWGTCTFSVTYSYRIAWIEMAETDVLYVRIRADDPWLGEAEIRADLAKGSDSGHIAKMRRFDRTLAFPSRAEAEAAFHARFGHAPSPRIVWSGWRPHSSMIDEPKLEGTTHACRTETLNVATGRAADEEQAYCLELVDPR